MPIKPHGGVLVNRYLMGEERKEAISRLSDMEHLTLNARETADLEMIADGAFSPLTGFMGREDYESVLQSTRLSNRIPWSIPITLSVKSANAHRFREDSWTGLYSQKGEPLAVFHIEERYTVNKEKEAVLIYKTNDKSHPGVDALYRMGDYYLGGKISMINPVQHPEFPGYRRTPSNLRSIFRERKWNRIVAFQTRNPIHRAHEYIQKCALEVCDGLLIHPLMGETKKGDIPAEVRMQCYEALLANYYPEKRTMLSVFPAYMRYAGPREAIFHAVVRKNYGCTHIIIGRDHAGVGNYYGTYEAQEIFSNFSREELVIIPLFFENSFFCRKCFQMASPKTCPHGDEHHLSLSGTKVREMLLKGEYPPPEFSRPEVASILSESYKRGEGTS